MHKEILRLKSLGLTNTDIAAACTCGRNTVTRTLARAQENGLTWEKARSMSQKEVSLKLFPVDTGVITYKMPDYEHVHREMQKSGEIYPYPAVGGILRAMPSKREVLFGFLSSDPVNLSNT